jgi:hypothetical protein
MAMDQIETDNDLDRPLWGGEAIGREAGVIGKDGKVDLRKTYHLLEHGHLPAEKFGRLWATTARRLRRRFAGEIA